MQKSAKTDNTQILEKLNFEVGLYHDDGLAYFPPDREKRLKQAIINIFQEIFEDPGWHDESILYDIYESRIPVIK